MAGAGNAQVRSGSADLWLEYKQRRDPAARAKLVERHLHLVRYIAGRLVVHLPASVELDDLLSYGVFGLIDAIDKFDFRRGIKFETYAYTRIKGAILDGLRSMDWAPQSLRKRGREVSAVYQRLETRLGRPATDEEVAAELGLDLAEFQNLMTRLNNASVLSLDDVVGFDEGDAIELRSLVADPDSPDPLAQAEMADARRRLTRALERLPHRERLVITLYYYEGLTVKEIGEILGLSASRISQLHGRAVARLRGSLMDREQ